MTKNEIFFNLIKEEIWKQQNKTFCALFELTLTGYFLSLAASSDAEIKNTRPFNKPCSTRSKSLKSSWFFIQTPSWPLAGCPQHVSTFPPQCRRWPAVGWLAMCLNESSNIAPNKSAIGQTTGSFLFESQILDAASKHYHAGRILWEDGGEHFKNLRSLCFSRRQIGCLNSFSPIFVQPDAKCAAAIFVILCILRKKKTSHCSHRPAAWFLSAAES